jgi:hypothetical protein
MELMFVVQRACDLPHAVPRSLKLRCSVGWHRSRGDSICPDEMQRLMATGLRGHKNGRFDAAWGYVIGRLTSDCGGVLIGFARRLECTP